MPEPKTAAEERKTPLLGAAPSSLDPEAAKMIRGLRDVSLMDMGSMFKLAARIEQIDRVDKGECTKDDVDVMTYRQMRELPPAQRRTSEVATRMVQVEETAARKAGMTRDRFLAEPDHVRLCEAVLQAQTNRSKARETAVDGLRKLTGRSINWEVGQKIMERYAPVPRPAYTPPATSVVTYRRSGFHI